jgi:ubiquinone/menaquinone biosynthesis C-methylase UbiE
MQSWDKTWEKVFRIKEWSKYPPEELIRFVANNFYSAPNRKAVKILDLGCGTGACTWYLAREGFSAYGIDGSKTGIKKAKQRFAEENLSGEFVVGDFIKILYPANFFDCVIDICSMQHNQFKFAKMATSEIFRVLKPGGKLFSMLVAGGSWKEPYLGKGYVHFYKLSEVKKLFEKFKNISIEKSMRTYNNRKIRSFIGSSTEKKSFDRGIL